MTLQIRGIDTDFVHHIHAGGADAHGQPAQRMRAPGRINPCRHCLQPIPAGTELLVLAYRPFATLQPYAEVGPIFLHAQTCPRYAAAHLPDWVIHLQSALVRGYGADDTIRYETGQVVAGAGLAEACTQILAQPEVAYVHIRSKFNCFQCRVERG